MTGGTQQGGPSKIGLEATFGSARHTRGVVWMEMPQLLGLSYQVILLLKRRRILLANCPQEAEYVNSQVTPCNAVPSGWPLCQCSGTLCGMLQSWKYVVDLSTSQWDG